MQTTSRRMRHRMARRIGMMWLLSWAVVPAVAGADLPLPAGVSTLAESSQVPMGRSTLHVTSFLSELDAEALVGFYEEALPSAGWRMDQLPWQADHASVTARLRKTLTYYRQAPKADALEQTLREFDETAQAMRRQIYASRGREHVIVHLWPTDGSGTMIFLNRWSGDRFWMEQGSRMRRSQGAGGSDERGTLR